jgi:hypothetical protein
VTQEQLDSISVGDDVYATLDGLARVLDLPLDRDLTTVAGSLLRPARRFEFESER